MIFATALYWGGRRLKFQEGKNDMDIKTVVFDMDGVLFDTERLCMDCWVRVAEEMDIHDMEEVFPLCIGLNANDTKALILNHYGQDFPYEEYKVKTSQWFWKEIKENGLPIKTGVKEILVFLKENDYKIGLASSTKYEAVIKHLERAGIRDYFVEVITGDMVEHSKPQPDIYLLACEKLGVKPEEAYAIEDSPNGIRSAYAAGMKPIMVPDMIAPDAEMEQLSFAIYNDLLEVKRWLT